MQLALQPDHKCKDDELFLIENGGFSYLSCDALNLFIRNALSLDFISIQ